MLQLGKSLIHMNTVHLGILKGEIPDARQSPKGIVAIFASQSSRSKMNHY